MQSEIDFEKRHPFLYYVGGTALLTFLAGMILLMLFVSI